MLQSDDYDNKLILGWDISYSTTELRDRNKLTKCKTIYIKLLLMNKTES